jgi:hypothetical protein
VNSSPHHSHARSSGGLRLRDQYKAPLPGFAAYHSRWYLFLHSLHGASLGPK